MPSNEAILKQERAFGRRNRIKIEARVATTMGRRTVAGGADQQRIIVVPNIEYDVLKKFDYDHTAVVHLLIPARHCSVGDTQMTSTNFA